MTTGPDAPPTNPSPTPPAIISSDEKTWALMAHLSSLVAMAIVVAVVGPLIVWLVKKDQSAYVAHHAKEALNFQITALIAFAAAVAVGLLTCGVLLVLVPAVVVANIVFTVVAAVRANEGVLWRYPVSLRLVA